jgi:ABC-type cobalamin/Fe3+-siderophores transport system ATPase subunit
LAPGAARDSRAGGGEQPPTFRPLDQLSTGQRCTAILYILLAKGNAPLIIDQPEDHLDNAFIADLIVEKLRSTKLKRQFLFATHNANIPVLGDAELIAVLKADSKSAKLTADAVGSVDKPEIQRQAADVLEGGHEAFTKRQRKYGF